MRTEQVGGRTKETPIDWMLRPRVLFVSLVISLLLVVGPPSVAGGEQGRPEISIQSGHNGIVSRVVFSPDGKLLASGTEDGAINIWGLADGRLLRKLWTTQRVVPVALSPDGNTLVVLSRKEVRPMKVFSFGESRTESSSST